MHLHTHDPFRGAKVSAPQITDDTDPVHRALRVVAWVDRYPPWPGGIAGGEMMLHGVMRRLADRGHDVAVVTHNHPGGDPVTYGGIPVHPETDAPGLIDSCDVLISHLLWTGQARKAAVRGQVPFVYLFHNDFTIPHWGLRPGHVTAAVFNTRWIRSSTLEQWPDWKTVPQVVVRPPVAPEAFEVRGPAIDREFVTLVNPNDSKGGRQFYEMAERRRQLRFLAVEGAYGHQIRPKRNVHSHVEWQRQTSDMLTDVFPRTRVLVVPSDYESFGLAAAEAAASGAVVVASDTLGLREALGPGGLFAPARNVDRWVAWLDALEDPDVYETASRAQRAHVASLAEIGVGEIDALERMLRLAAAAERVPSGAMGGHDPFRRQRQHANRVDVAQPAESPQDSPEPVPAAGQADAPLSPAESHTEAVAPGQDATEGALVGDAVERELIPTHTHPGAGVDRETAGGDAGHTPDGEGREALTSETVAPGDGAPSHDEGQPSPELAPTTTGPVPGDAAQPADPGAGPDPDGPPPLVDQVPQNATGDDGVVAWINSAGTDAERWDRAAAAEWVEDQRPKVKKKKRKAIMDAIGPVLYED